MPHLGWIMPQNDEALANTSTRFTVTDEDDTASLNVKVETIAINHHKVCVSDPLTATLPSQPGLWHSPSMAPCFNTSSQHSGSWKFVQAEISTVPIYIYR